MSPWVHPPNGIADAAKGIWRSVRAVSEAICRPVICRSFLRGVGPFVQLIQRYKTAKLLSQRLRKTACKTVTEKLLIISHGNTVPLMTRIDVIKGKSLRERRIADPDQGRNFFPRSARQAPCPVARIKPCSRCLGLPAAGPAQRQSLCSGIVPTHLSNLSLRAVPARPLMISF